MKRLPMLVVTLGLSTAVLAGCGGGTDQFCSDLKSAKKDLSGSSAVTSQNFEKSVDRIHSLAEEAPDDVKSDWETVDKTFAKIAKTFKDAGVTSEVLQQLQQGKKPSGLSTADVQKVATTIQSTLGDSKFATAQKNVNKHADETCNVKLDA